MKNWLAHKPEEFLYSGKWIRNWFSNFEPVNLWIEGRQWPSVENYYQAMKTNDPVIQEQIRCSSPSEAKRYGRKIKMNQFSDWESRKTGVMKQALMAKFQQDRWRKALLSTGTEPIIEWNNWGDQIWGVTLDGIGENRLGLLLMAIREKLQKESE